MYGSNNSGGGSTGTQVNKRAIDRGVGDSETSSACASKTRSPHHSTEGGNYKYIDYPKGWGGNVHR